MKKHIVWVISVAVLIGVLALAPPPRFLMRAVGVNEATLQAADKKAVALTFDDGPHELCTPQILDALAKVEGKATFFISGWRLEDPANIEYLKRTASEGHQLGNHRYSHREPSLDLDINQFEKEVRTTNELVQRYTGITPKVYRHPWGKGNREEAQVIKSLGMKIRGWDSKIKDGQDKSPLSEDRTDQYYRRLMEAVQPGRRVLLHDARGNVNAAAAIDRALPILVQQGYTFVRLDTLEELQHNRTVATCLWWTCARVFQASN